MFPKGLVHDFGQKMLIYISCICWKKCLEKISGDVLDRKQAIPGYKNINFILLPINFLFLVFVRKKCLENIFWMFWMKI